MFGYNERSDSKLFGAFCCAPIIASVQDQNETCHCWRREYHTRELFQFDTVYNGLLMVS
jgi:hypothetical protein